MSNYTENFTSTSGDTVDSTELETEFDAIAAAIATKIDSDGSGTMSGSLDMGNNKIENVSSPTAANDGVNFSSLAIRQIQISTVTADTSTSSTTFQTSGLEGSITLNHSDSKILIYVSAFVGSTGASGSARYSIYDIYNVTSAAQIQQTNIGRALVATSTGSAPSYGNLSLLGTETPGAGTYTYRCRFRSSNASSTAFFYGSSGIQATMVILECAP